MMRALKIAGPSKLSRLTAVLVVTVAGLGLAGCDETMGSKRPRRSRILK